MELNKKREAEILNELAKELVKNPRLLISLVLDYTFLLSKQVSCLKKILLDKGVISKEEYDKELKEMDCETSELHEFLDKLDRGC